MSKYDLPFDKIESSVMEWVTEALEARHGEYEDPEGKLSLPDLVEVGPAGVQHSLLRVRARLDRVDELLAKATRAKHRASRALEEARWEASNAWNKASTSNNTNSRFQDYSTGKERDAVATLATFDLQREVHRLTRMVDVTVEAWTVIKQLYWSMDSLRNDHVSVLRNIQFESSLDR